MSNKEMDVALTSMLLAESNIEFSREFREALKMDPRINIPWGDWMVDEDSKRRDYFLDLSDSEWRQVVEKHLDMHKANVRPALAWVERIQRQRVARAAARAEERPHETKTALDITFGAWKDMVEEPWKYGDNDWSEWLEMDNILRNSPKRWRVIAFWQKKQDEADEESRKAFVQMLVDAKTRFNNRMATRIQAAWRGHVVRDTLPNLSCPKCLSHKPARFKFADGSPACLECMVDSFGWNDFNKCEWCATTLDAGCSALCDARFCSPDCQMSWMKHDDCSNTVGW